MGSKIKSIEIGKILKELLKRWWVLVLSIAFFSVISYYVTVNLMTPIYRASSTVFIGREGAAQDNLTIADLTLGQRLAIDYRQLIMTGLVLEEVITRLPENFRNISVGRNLLISVVPDSRFIYISFDDPWPERATQFVNTLSEVLKEKSVLIFGVGNMHIIDYARIPFYPIRPNVLNNTILAGFLGFLLAAMLLSLRLVYYEPVQKQEDVENESGLPVIGIIPRIKEQKSKAKQWNIESALTANPFLKESYRIVEANLTYMNIDKKFKVIMFTSALPGEGKTNSISSMAFILASSGKKVLLIDCDLRRGRIHSLFNINRISGLTNCLAQGADCTDNFASFSNLTNLSILTTGVLPPTPTDVLASIAFENFINDIKGQFDYVLIDTPPVLLFADAALISRVSDGIIMIAASGVTKKTDLTKTKTLLEKTGARIMGVLLTNARISIERKYYSYNNKK